MRPSSSGSVESAAMGIVGVAAMVHLGWVASRTNPDLSEAMEDNFTCTADGIVRRPWVRTMQPYTHSHVQTIVTSVVSTSDTLNFLWRSADTVVLATTVISD